MSIKLNPRRLRIILFVLMLLIVIGAGAGFVFAKSQLDAYATTISNLNADAASEVSNIQTLRTLEKTLNDEQAAVDAAKKVVASNSTYADTIISTISAIASSSGITLTSLSFVDAGGAAAGSTTPAAPATPTTEGATPTTSTPPGVTKKSVSVSLKSPVNYTAFMKFIQAIETNDLKMQLTTVALTSQAGGEIATQDLIVEVFVRS